MQRILCIDPGQRPHLPSLPMKKLLWILTAGLMTLKANASNSPAVVTPIKAQPQRVEITHPETQRRFTQTRFVLITEKLAPAITLDAASSERLLYTLQGSIASGGLHIQKFRNIHTEQSVQGSLLTVRHTVQVQRIAGKEDSGIRGYNYQQKHALVPPKHIQQIRIELLQAQAATERSDVQPRLIAETHLDWPPQHPLPTATQPLVKP